MAIPDAIPTIVSARFQRWLRQTSIFASRTNMQYSGELSEDGRTVVIPAIDEDSVSVGSYAFDANDNPPDTLAVTYGVPNVTTQSLVLNKAHWFGTKLHDIHRQQLRPALLDRSAQLAAVKMSEQIDTDVIESIIGADLATTDTDADPPTGGTLNAGLSLHQFPAGKMDVSNDGGSVDVAIALLEQTVGAANRRMDRAHVPGDGRWIILPPELRQVIESFGAGVDTTIFSMKPDDALGRTNRFVGKWHDFDVYYTDSDSARLHATSPNGKRHAVNMLFGNDYALAMAMVIDQVEQMRLEAEFATGIRGLNHLGLRAIENSFINARFSIDGLL